MGDLRVKHNVQTSSSPLPSLVTNSSILNNEKKMQTLKMMVGRELCEKRRRSKVAIDVPETKTSRKRYIQPEREKKRRKIAQGGDIATEAERKGNENDLTATELHHIYGDSEDAFAIKHNANHEATSTGSTDDGQYDYAAGGQFPPHTNDSKHGSSGGCHAYYCSDKDIDRMYDYTRVGEINTSIDDRDACTLYRVVHHQPCSRYMYISSLAYTRMRGSR